MTHNFGSFAKSMRREMRSADDLWARANDLRRQGRVAEAEKLEEAAERIDNRHSNTNYSTWLNRQ
jgi:hypothetical protein